jgi:diguanylate cyclase (GGDEF)-like protein/PAS domain S-box-containing protein
MLGRGEAVRNSAGVATRMAGSFSDISEQKATEIALARQTERSQVTLQSIADAVITTNNDGAIIYMNPAAERLTGWLIGDARGRAVGQVLDFLTEFGTSSINDTLKVGLQGGEAGATDLGQAELLSRSGEKHIVEHSIAPLRDRKRKIIGGVIVIHDVTDRFKLMQQLSHQAIHDPLTQLTNRTGFELKLNEAMKSAAEESNIEHAICYMDLDQFKIVNDTCGHSAGDELLRQIAGQLKKHVRKGDTLARLGGDEFGLLLACCPLTKAVEIAEKIRNSVEAFRFSWEGKSFSVGVSIGIAPFDGSPGSNGATILSTVDQACYIAKSKGRNRVHTYQPGDNESSRWHSEMQWVPHIHQAMDDGHFVLLAQPIVAVDNAYAKSKHYEILLRMKAANGDLIAPGSFLPAAERYDLMGMLDRWVVGHAIEMLALAWGSNRDLANTIFGINISGAVLTDNTLLDYVKEVLGHYKLPPSLLCFEITETVAIANFTHANRFVNELKEIGCRFALDDFGSGFASFSYLKTLPVDYLKIDGSFVRHLADNEVDLTMVDIINQLGHVMGLETIAEFVENERILEALGRLGVDYAQGYHVGRPAPLHDICYGEGSEAALQILPA